MKSKTGEQPAPAQVLAIKVKPVCFMKEIFSNAYHVGGKPAPFEQIGSNRGVLCIDPTGPLKEWVAPLLRAAEDQVGGIVKVSEDEVEELKKNHPLKKSDPNSSSENVLRVTQRQGWKQPQAPKNVSAETGKSPLAGKSVTGTPAPPTNVDMQIAEEMRAMGFNTKDVAEFEKAEAGEPVTEATPNG